MTDEQLQAKKAAILQYTGVGLPFERACILVNLDPDSIKVLQDDRAFQFCIQQAQATLEYSLLEQIVEVAKRSSRTELTGDAKWLLEKLNPEAWGKKDNAASSFLGFVIPNEYDGV